MNSKGSKVIAREFNTRRVYPDGKYRYREGDIILNWGNANSPQWEEYNTLWLNKPREVSIASNKLRLLQRLYDKVRTVEWTTSTDKVREWLEDGYIVYARHHLRGSSGSGIQVLNNPQYIPYAPLYTKAVNIRGEYRVHILDGKMIDYTKKRRRNDTEVNTLIRNHGNGWVFCRRNLNIINENETIAKKAIKESGLSFGAVDIVRGQEGRSYILEINTAPGMEGTTIQKYIENLKEINDIPC